MKTLIISDPHEKIETCLEIVKRFPDVDRRVWLGDFYDSFEWCGRGEATALFHKQVIADPKNIVLMGNHDTFYRWPEIAGMECTGNSRHQLLACQRVLTPEDWAKTGFYCWIDGWLVSHAGVRDWLHPWQLEARTDECYAHLSQGRMHSMVAAGASRGGRQSYGGITWLHFEKEFQPVPGLNQIVGHTRRNKVRAKNTQFSQNYCIDTDLAHIAFIENGTLEIVHV